MTSTLCGSSGTRVAVMEQGKLVELDTVDAIYQRPAHPTSITDPHAPSPHRERAIDGKERPMERRALLEVKHLNSFYEEGNGILSAGKRRKQVLQDVSFSLYQGEVLGLVGESGSGKATLSRAIVGASPGLHRGAASPYRPLPRKWCFRTPTAA
ncbi:MAG: ATP-binding cassette domain-containing protein [Oscillospiraceae bacterium]